MGPKKLVWFDGPKSSFSPFKTSCVLMDPKPHVVWWTLIRVFKVFPSQNLMCFDGPTTQPKPHVFWWTQNLMWFDGPLMIFRVHQITWGFWVHQNTGVHKKLMWFDGPIFSTSLGPSNHMRFLQLLWLTSKDELILYWFKQCFCSAQKISETFAYDVRFLRLTPENRATTEFSSTIFSEL